MVSDSEVFQIHDQPPPVIVERMRSERTLLWDPLSKPHSIDGLWSLF